MSNWEFAISYEIAILLMLVLSIFGSSLALVGACWTIWRFLIAPWLRRRRVQRSVDRIRDSVLHWGWDKDQE